MTPSRSAVSRSACFPGGILLQEAYLRRRQKQGIRGPLGRLKKVTDSFSAAGGLIKFSSLQPTQFASDWLIDVGLGVCQGDDLLLVG